MNSKKYFPELLSRQGELNAWGLSVLAIAGVFFLSLREVVPGWAWFLAGILTVSAASISLGNWMDRNTYIEITSAGITFRNSIRIVEMSWTEILEVKTLPDRWGRTVQVFGNNLYFSFTTYGEMKFRNEVKSKIGCGEICASQRNKCSAFFFNKEKAICQLAKVENGTIKNNSLVDFTYINLGKFKLI